MILRVRLLNEVAVRQSAGFSAQEGNYVGCQWRIKGRVVQSYIQFLFMEMEMLFSPNDIQSNDIKQHSDA